MPDVLAAISAGGYLSPIKFVVFLVLYFAWLVIIDWVHKDAEALGTKHTFWTGVVFGVWAAAGIIWLLIPMFVIGMAFYLIAAGAATISYVMHRNALVPEFQRMLTFDYFKDALLGGIKKKEPVAAWVFISSNNNEVPVPQAKTPDYFGYKAAYAMFDDAIYRRAFDVICTPTPQGYDIGYNIDGTILKQPGIAKDQMDYLLRFLKSLANLDMEEKRKPQKGKFTIYKQGKRIDFELMTAGSNVGEQMRAKLVTQQLITKLSDLGLSADQLAQLGTLKAAKKGLFIVSGPKNSGVTTTFYTLLRTHDAFLNGITTLERQPSGKLPNIPQNTYVLGDSGITTYGKKLLSIVRMDPDIVGVADCEDTETAQVACTAAESKLVYVVIEEENVLRALGKWIKLVGDKAKAIENLVGVSNQRLLRKLCDQCKQAYEPNSDLLHKFNMPAEKAKVLYRTGKVVYDKRGKASPCENCQETGFFGRMCIFETIILNEQLRNVIKQMKSLTDVGTELRRAKMLYLQEQGLIRVVAGITSINEMVRVLTKAKDQKPAAEEQQ
jgi:type II secretory ATPase GspE/PulE/Tfp pilus assembly ATPase PilB-like protein